MKHLLPPLAWLLWLLVAQPSFLQGNWEIALVLFAAWVLAPEALFLLRLPVRRWYWPIAFGLAQAYYLTEAPASWRALLALPYVVFALWVTVRELAQLFTLPNIQLPDLVRLAALFYWSTGAVFALSFLAEYQPLGFDPMIVSLTAAHFHIAGFVLATVAYRMLLSDPGRITTLCGWGVLAGMPSVATGIVLTHWGFDPVFEWVSALIFVLFTAVLVGWHLNKLRDSNYPPAARLYWFCGTICLLAGIALASLYALRFVYPISWVHIPNMKIWHGTLNTIGFGWLVLRGWRQVKEVTSARNE
ncbi:MAG: YndJ family transporter [Saprospiraceae bacterium]|nr:YndJ family transporter [Saprospiraceae bacterium]